LHLVLLHLAVVVVAPVIPALAVETTEGPAGAAEFQAVLPVVLQEAVLDLLVLLAKDLMVAIKEAAAQHRQLAVAVVSANKELMDLKPEI
jgi:hypothetical protein